MMMPSFVQDAAQRKQSNGVPKLHVGDIMLAAQVKVGFGIGVEVVLPDFDRRLDRARYLRKAVYRSRQGRKIEVPSLADRGCPPTWSDSSPYSCW